MIKRGVGERKKARTQKKARKGNRVKKEQNGHEKMMTAEGC